MLELRQHLARYAAAGSTATCALPQAVKLALEMTGADAAMTAFFDRD